MVADISILSIVVGQMALRVVEYRQLVQIIAMFMIVQFTGLLLATQVFTGASYIQVQGIETVSSSLNVLFYIGYIIVFSIVLILVFKIYKGDKLFLFIEAAVIFIASFIVFLVSIAALQGAAFSSLYGSGSMVSLIIAGILSLALVAAKYKMPRLRNLAAIIASIGVGLVLGLSFSFLAAMIFMVVLAAYDFIAVFVTKHMIALGNLAVEKNLSFLIMVNEVEAVPLKQLDKSQRKEYNKTRNEIRKRHGTMAESLAKKDMVPFMARTALGTGDLAMPLMVAVAAYKVQLNFVLSFVVIMGAVLGLIITMMVLRRYKRALPAIPPLLFGIAVTLSVYFLFVHP